MVEWGNTSFDFGVIMAEKKSSKTTSARPKKQRKKLSEAMIIALIGFAGAIIAGFLGSPLIGGQVPIISEPQVTLGPTPTFTLHPNAVGPIQTLTSIANTIEILGQIATKVAETSTPTPVITPIYKTYHPLIVFDNNLNDGYSDCWQNETTEPFLWFDGFFRRGDGNWGFRLDKSREADQLVRTDFSNCISEQVRALAVNAWVAELDLESDFGLGREFGFFIEDTSGGRREYTIWIDKNRSMHLRVRELNQIIVDTVVLIIVNDNSLKFQDAYPRRLATFPIQILLGLNNQGLDILYMQEGPWQEAVSGDDFNPNQMILIDAAVLPTLDNIRKFGLIGYGGDTQIVIWPLVIYGE